MLARTLRVALVLCGFAVVSVYVSAQSGPADALSGPASATAADLANDPSGLFHLKARFLADLYFTQNPRRTRS